MSIEARIEDTGRGVTVKFKDRYLYSRHQPDRRPNLLAGQAGIEHRCIYFVPSPLLGYGLKIFADRLPADSIILAVEQSEQLMALCSRHIPHETINHPSLVIVRLSDRNSLHALLYRLGPWKYRRVRRLDLSGGAATDPELYNLLSNFLVEDLANYWRNRHALGRLGRQWIRHIYANLTAMEREDTVFNSLADLRFSGVPVVAGAGPSLEASLDFLRKRRSGLWILATDTAVPALLDADIKPDAIAVLETQAWNMLDFHGTGLSEISVLGDITAYPPSLQHTGGRCYFVSSRFAEMDFLGRLDDAGLTPSPIPPLGSVGLAAVEMVLRQTGSKSPVLLTGIDFAYSPGKSHSRGSSFHHWQLAEISRLNPQPGWDASMKRPRVPGFSASGIKLNSDTVLGGYAALFKDRYAGLDRLLVLAPGGVDLGVPVIHQDDAEQLLFSGDGLPDSREIAGTENTGDSRDFKVLAKAFLDEEELRLQRVIDEWEYYVENHFDSDSLMKALEEMDQIYADFPDEPPLPKNDRSFLVRAVDRCRKLQRYIRRNRQDSSSSVRSTERKAD